MRLKPSSLVVAMIVATASALAGDNEPETLSLGIFFGPSIPDAAITRVYNELDTGSLSSAYDAASGLGYHLGGKVRFGLSDAVSFSAAVQYSQFPGQEQTAVLTDGTRLQLTTVTTYVPVFAGITIIPTRSLVNPYLSAELVYSFRQVSVSEGNSILENLITGVGQDLEPSSSRFGAALGGGVEFNVGGLRPFVELKYTWTNLVGKEESEPTRAFLNVSFGIVL